jgi:hypothetical protein
MAVSRSRWRVRRDNWRPLSLVLEQTLAAVAACVRAPPPVSLPMCRSLHQSTIVVLVRRRSASGGGGGQHRVHCRGNAKRAPASARGGSLLYCRGHSHAVRGHVYSGVSRYDQYDAYSKYLLRCFLFYYFVLIEPFSSSECRGDVITILILLYRPG